MKIAVLGAGMQGTACALDLSDNPNIHEIALADMDLDKAVNAIQKINHPKVVAQTVDVRNHHELVRFLTPYDVVVSAVPYFLNLAITQAAIDSQTHMVDMGGNTDLVFQQRELSANAKAANVTILPDAGLAPGLANIMAVHGINQLEHVDSVRIRVGGLPRFPKSPLNYQLFFSIHGLINEYVGKSVVLREGQVTEVDTLTEVETLEFRQPIGACEAFHTLGGISTLPWTYADKIQTMDYKTIRYPGHCSQIKAMADLGLFSQEPIRYKGIDLSPRDIFATVATPRLIREDNRDIVLVRVTIEGEKRGEAIRLTYEIMDQYDEETQLTAMMRTTAFPVSILAQMVAEGIIQDRGVLPLEKAVPTQYFMEELEKRNIRIWSDTVPLTEKHVHC